MKLECTKRFVIEPLLNCNITCKFCYHLHKKYEWDKYTKTFEEVKKEINAGKTRGNEWMDITGGEPTIYPDIFKVIQYAHSIGLKVCIITNGIVSEKRTQKLLDVGIDEFLVSRHGSRDTHNLITNTKDGFNKQLRFLKQIKDKVSIRFNCVITKLSQEELYAVALDIYTYKPIVVNYINFNPHQEWRNVDFSKSEIIADLRIVENFINKAIKFLIAKGIGVNIRYYPMCRIAQKYRKYVCNDLQVMFDPYEWDYGEYPKTIEKFYQHGRAISNVEEKGQPCCNCDLQWTCGGINKHWHKVGNELFGEICEPQSVPEIRNLSDIDKMRYYRRNNGTTNKS